MNSGSSAPDPSGANAESGLANRGGTRMRLVHWEIGVLLGAITGGSALLLGVIALLVASRVWCGRHASPRARSALPGC